MAELTDLINLARFITGTLILLYASVCDVKTREVGDRLWVLMGVCGGVFIVLDVPDLTQLAISFLISVPFAFLLYFFGMGGADVKAMWGITLLAPLTPGMFFLPYVASPLFVFPVIVLLDALLLIIALLPIYGLYNLSKGSCEFPYCLFGYKLRASLAKNSFVWSMETPYKKSIFPIKKCDFDEFGDREIWVTPQIPFLVFICAGFIMAFLFGDILSFILSLTV